MRLERPDVRRRYPTRSVGIRDLKRMPAATAEWSPFTGRSRCLGRPLYAVYRSWSVEQFEPPLGRFELGAQGESKLEIVTALFSPSRRRRRTSAGSCASSMGGPQWAAGKPAGPGIKRSGAVVTGMRGGRVRRLDQFPPRGDPSWAWPGTGALLTGASQVTRVVPAKAIRRETDEGTAGVWRR